LGSVRGGVQEKRYQKRRTVGSPRREEGALIVGKDGVEKQLPLEQTKKFSVFEREKITLSIGSVTEMSYWTFTDAFFEEGGVFKSVFSSGFGLIATGRIPKASFNAFKILHHLGDQKLALESDSALLTRRSTDDGLVLAIWNYVPPRETGQPKTVHLQFRSSERAPERARIHLVDDDHGSPFHGRRWGVLIARGSNSKPFCAKPPNCLRLRVPKWWKESCQFRYSQTL
jgi:hypothetical protein